MPREIGLPFATPSILAMLEVPPRKNKARRIPHDRLPNVGDIVWVREGLKCFAHTPRAFYVADEKGVKDKDGWGHDWHWKNWVLPSIFMPKSCARIWLRVTDKRLEPLQAITHEDILAEGYVPLTTVKSVLSMLAARNWFYNLWNSLAKPGKRWEDNPEVAVIGFEILSTEGRPE